MRTRDIALVLALATAVGLGAAGCSHKISGTFVLNQRPVVRLTWAPIKPPTADSSSAEFYIYKMNWTGYDPDGRVVSYQYSVDPPTAARADTPWVTTTKNEQVISFPASKPDAPRTDNTQLPRSRDFHVFVLRAVDNQGAVSVPVVRAFFSYGVAPEVQILHPTPLKLLSPQVTPAFQVNWTGKDYIDPNGLLFEKPVKYKYKLYPMSKVPSGWITNPDSIRIANAPGFAGWDSVGGDTTSVQYTSLTPGSEYLFVIVAIGRSGAYSPVFSRDQNVLVLSVTLAGMHGPIMTMFNSYFFFTYPSGGIPTNMDPSWAIPLQVPAGLPLTFNWEAQPPAGSLIQRYRWVMDLTDIEDETPRSSQNDVNHWSSWSLNVTSATVGPFNGINPTDPMLPETHDFFVEAEDVNGLRSLAWVHFLVVPFRSDKDLLIVKDTRLDVDYRQSSWPPDSVGRPTGNWPTTAELDTFLFAVGGVRWKSTPTTGYYGGLSPPGIFKGYRYDTIGTRKGIAIPTQWISLDTLSHYTHIIWISSPIKNQEWDKTMGAQPMTTLRYMSAPNRQNMLSTWVKQGGQLWALGGAFGEGTNTGPYPGGWNRVENDGQARTYSYVDQYKDLRPGRFMFDLSHWQSEFRTASGIKYRLARLDQRNPDSSYPPPRGDWLGEPLRDPRFAALPTRLRPKDKTTDPLWPGRGYPDFYLNNPSWSDNGIDLEFLSADNRITEEQGDPDNPTEVSTLDTLYLAYGSYPHVMLVTQNGEGVNACMTYYHGSDNPPLVFTGFDIWHWQRQNCVDVVNVVLQNLWGMSRTAPVASAQPSPASIRRAAAPAGQRPIQRPALRPFGGIAHRPPVTSTLKRLH